MEKGQQPETPPAPVHLGRNVPCFPQCLRSSFRFRAIVKPTTAMLFSAGKARSACPSEIQQPFDQPTARHPEQHAPPRYTYFRCLTYLIFETRRLASTILFPTLCKNRKGWGTLVYFSGKVGPPARLHSTQERP